MHDIPEEAVKAAVEAVDEGVNWVAVLFGEKYDNAEEVMRSALTAALPHLPGVGVKALPRAPKDQSDIGWTLPIHLLEELRKEADGWADEISIEGVEAIALSTERSILSALEPSAAQERCRDCDGYNCDDGCAYPEPSAARELSLEEGFRKGLEAACEVIDKHSEYDRRLCCDGSECGCYGATVHQSMQHYIRALSSPDHADAGKVEGDGWLPMTHPDLPLNGASVVMFDSFIPGKDGFGQVIARFDKTHGWHVSASVVGGKYIQLTNPIKWRPLFSAPSQEVAGS